MPRKQADKYRVDRPETPADYPSLLANIKQRIRTAQVRAAFSANAELICLYWDIGRAIAEQQRRQGWGSGVIPRLARDLRNELPEVKGFSERNLKYMIRFYREYGAAPIVQQPAAQLPSARNLTSASGVSPPPVAKSADASLLALVQQLAAQLPWFHHVLLMEKVKDLPTRVWHMQ